MKHNEIGCVRPRLRHDVVFTDTGHGVQVRTASAGVVVKGAAAYVFATRLAPFLTGERTVDELCAAVADDRRASLTGFVRTMLDHGFARDMRSAQPAQDERFAAQIGFVEHYLDDAGDAFRRFQHARILLTGTGSVMTAVADVLVRNGAQNVLTMESTVDSQSFDAVCGTDLAHSAAAVAVPLVIHAGKAYFGPATRPGSRSCGMCLRLWLASGDAAPHLSEPQAAFIGNALATEVFRQLTGVPAQTDGHVVVHDLKTLASHRERALRHPSCGSCEDCGPSPAARALPEPMAGFRSPDRTDLRALLGDLDLVAGRVTGAVTGFEDTSVTQSPVKVGQARLRQGRLITGFDLHHVPVARQRATHAALLVHAGEVANIRGHVTKPANLKPADTVPPHEIITWSGRDAEDQPPWLPATSLVSGKQYFVPAAAVHPFSSYNHSGSYDRSSAGDGIGPTFEEATQRGLLTALAYDALGSGHTEPVDSRALQSDPELEFLARTLDVLGLDTELTDLTPSHAHRVVLARTRDARLASAGSALSLRAAVVSALRDLIGQVQLCREGLPADLGNPLVPHTSTPIYGSSAPQAGATADLAGRLACHDIDALVADTTPPDVAQLGLVTARVLLRPSSPLWRN